MVDSGNTSNASGLTDFIPTGLPFVPQTAKQYTPNCLRSILPSRFFFLCDLQQSRTPVDRWSSGGPAEELRSALRQSVARLQQASGAAVTTMKARWRKWSSE